MSHRNTFLPKFFIDTMAETTFFRKKVGRATWITIHSSVYGINSITVTDNVPWYDALHTYVDTVTGILELFPCSLCGQHLREKHRHYISDLWVIDADALAFSKTPVGEKHTQTPERFLRRLELWGFHFHNAVSSSIGTTNNDHLMKLSTKWSDDEIISFMRRTHCAEDSDTCAR